MLPSIIGFLLLAAAFVAYWVARNKGYSGILFAVVTLFFPVMLIVAYVLPDKSRETKKAEIQRRFEESIEKQEREMAQMCARIRELEGQQPVQSKSTSKPVPKAEPKPTSAPRLTRENITADQVVLQQHSMELYRDKNYKLALPYFVQLAEAGHLDSQMYAAQMFYQGQGTDVNYEKALYWYERAAELGQPIAQSNVATMYKDGQGCTADLKKALYWKEKAAEQGNPDVQLAVGMMYELGQGTHVDLQKARYWYEKSAAQGNANAQKLLDGMNY